MATETEFKRIVSEKELERLEQILAALSPSRTYLQVNYYYDTPDLFYAARHETLRVRRKGSSLRVQFKTKRSRKDDIFVCSELEAKIKELPPVLTPSDYFKDTGDRPAHLLGSLATQRTDFDYGGCIISLDRNIYLGNYDCELEIEGPENAVRVLMDTLKVCGKSPRKSGKFSRFLNAYLTMKEIL